MLRSSIFTGKYIMYYNISKAEVETVSAGVVPGLVRCQSHE